MAVFRNFRTRVIFSLLFVSSSILFSILLTWMHGYCVIKSENRKTGQLFSSDNNKYQNIEIHINDQGPEAKTSQKLNQNHLKSNIVQPKTSVTRRRLILFYTTLWGRKPWPGFESTHHFNNWRDTSCTVQNCDLTYDKSLASQADALVFHGVGTDMVSVEELQKLSERRHADQVWIYFVHEPPHGTNPRPHNFNGYFNWTMNYRRDADITAIYNWEWGTWEKIPDTEPRRKVRDYTNGKDRLVYAAISHCGLFREMYIKKLQEYIDVDVFGGCSSRFHNPPKICHRFNKDCTELTKRYKFFLAFENSFCPDYISEKFHETILDDNAVPVVLGGADYKALAIEKSYISALDFDTVEDLANHLKFLDKNDQAYNEYQKWRENHRLGKPRPWSCDICRMVNEKRILRKSYHDLGRWYGEKSCGVNLHRFKSIMVKSNVPGPYKDQYYEI